MSTHTPGPWHAAKSQICHSYFVIEDFVVTESRVCVAFVGGPLITGDENTANARLIAAAPDYYASAEAIREFVLAADRGNPCIIPDDLIRNLLNAHYKAEGR